MQQGLHFANTFDADLNSDGLGWGKDGQVAAGDDFQSWHGVQFESTNGAANFRKLSERGRRDDGRIDTAERAAA